jgi:hypothetical protein
VCTGGRGHIAGTALGTLHSELARWVPVYTPEGYLGKKDMNSVEIDIDPLYFVNIRPVHHKVTQHE